MPGQPAEKSWHLHAAHIRTPRPKQTSSFRRAADRVPAAPVGWPTAPHRHQHPHRTAAVDLSQLPSRSVGPSLSSLLHSTPSIACVRPTSGITPSISRHAMLRTAWHLSGMPCSGNRSTSHPPAGSLKSMTRSKTRRRRGISKRSRTGPTSGTGRSFGSRVHSGSRCTGKGDGDAAPRSPANAMALCTGSQSTHDQHATAAVAVSAIVAGGTAVESAPFAVVGLPRVPSGFLAPGGGPADRGTGGS